MDDVHEVGRVGEIATLQYNTSTNTSTINSNINSAVTTNNNNEQ